MTNVAFVAADWYAGIPAGTFDLIVSNPPYIGAVDPHLQEGDLRFEPVSALSPGVDGHVGAAHRSSAARANACPPAAGSSVEHGYDQSDAVQALFRDAGFAEVTALRDLAGIPRVVAGR